VAGGRPERRRLLAALAGSVGTSEYVDLEVPASLVDVASGPPDDERHLARGENASLLLQTRRAAPLVVELAATVDAPRLEHSRTLIRTVPRRSNVPRAVATFGKFSGQHRDSTKMLEKRESPELLGSGMRFRPDDLSVNGPGIDRM
jgi:hypothetical protein